MTKALSFTTLHESFFVTMAYFGVSSPPGASSRPAMPTLAVAVMPRHFTSWMWHDSASPPGTVEGSRPLRLKVLPVNVEELSLVAYMPAPWLRSNDVPVTFQVDHSQSESPWPLFHSTRFPVNIIAAPTSSHPKPWMPL